MTMINTRQFMTNKYGEYGKYINWSRAVPGLDGLKLVQRRIMLATHLEVSESFKKCTRIVSRAMLYHPHGDTSIFQTLVGLVQNGLVLGQGNWGNKYGLERLDASAPRYIEAKENKNTPIFWDGIKFVQWDVIELEKEPLYIPTIVPISLVMKDPEVGIGMALKYLCPIFEQEEMIKYSKDLISNGKSKIIPKPYLENHKLLSSDKEIQQLLETGKGKMEYIGEYSIDEKKMEIILHTIPFNKKIDTLLKKVDDYIKSSHLEIVDESTNKTSIRLTLINQRRLKFSQLEKYVSDFMKVSVSYNIVLYDYRVNYLRDISVNEWIFENYDLFKDSILGQLNDTHEKLQIKLNEVMLLLQIQKVLPDYMNRDLKYDNIVKGVTKDIGAKLNDVQEIFKKYTLERILKANIDKGDIIKKIEQVDKNIKEIDKYCLTFYK